MEKSYPRTPQALMRGCLPVEQSLPGQLNLFRMDHGELRGETITNIHRTSLQSMLLDDHARQELYTATTAT